MGIEVGGRDKTQTNENTTKRKMKREEVRREPRTRKSSQVESKSKERGMKMIGDNEKTLTCSGESPNLEGGGDKKKKRGRAEEVKGK